MKVLITGGAKNLGKNIALEFAKNKYDIVINYNNSYDEAIELKENIENEYKVNVKIIKCNISNEIEVKNMINEIDNLDVLVNNAAIELNSEFDEKTYNSFKKVLDTNLIGTFLVSKYASRIMKKGHIINIVSNNAINMYDPSTLEYDASKAGIISLTHNLAIELAPNINVNAVAPGWILTDNIKELDESLNNEFIKEESKNNLKNRFANPEEVASLVYYLTTNDYINNEIIKIDGGTR